MRVAVTGASGFVGRHVAARLRERGAQVRAVVRDRDRARRELTVPDVEFRVADVARPETLQGAFDGCDAVVHTVAIPTERHGSFERINARGTDAVVAEAERAGVRRFVHVSAIGADPASPYPFLRSKGHGERAALGFRGSAVAVRPSILFGPGDDFFPRLGFTLRFPIVPVPGDGQASFQPLHVDDLAQVLAAAVERPEVTGAHELGGPDRVTYDDLLAETMRGYGRRRPTLHLPVLLMKPAAFVMGLVLADPPVTVPQLDLLAVPNVPAENAAERAFGVRPRPFRGGLGYLRSA